jgi:uncharacterized membrane protein
MWMRKLPGYFLRGALVTAPFALTLYIIGWLLRAVDRFLPLGIPGLGLLLVLVLITLAGFLTSNVVGKSFIDATDRFLKRLPLVKLVYTSIKDLIGAFVGDHKSFDRPVSVQVAPGSPVKMLGFVTRRGLHVLGMPEYVAVYCPQSYNFAGNLLIVPADMVEPLDVSSGELMTFVVSGGVSGLGVGQSVLPLPPASTPYTSPGPNSRPSL